jgi:hypothetical protein
MGYTERNKFARKDKSIVDEDYSDNDDQSSNSQQLYKFKDNLYGIGYIPTIEERGKIIKYPNPLLESFLKKKEQLD